MSAEILNKINCKIIANVIAHRESSDLMTFLSLPGYAMLHNYQYFAESIAQRRLKKYIITAYEQSPIDEIPADANLLHPLLKNRKRSDLKPNDRWGILQKTFEAYNKWECDTLDLYEQIAKQLSQSGELADYAFVMELVKDVSEESRYVSGLVYAYQSMEWDISQINAEQDTFFEKYSHKIGELFKNIPKYHHWNSA